MGSRNLTKAKGDLAELRVASDLLSRGYKIAFPYGEDWDYDLILCRNEQLERVQVKYTSSDGTFITVRCQSNSLTNGKVKRIKHYTPEMIDWIAIYDSTSDRCYYVPACELGEHGRSTMILRLTPTKNGQRLGVRFADDYVDLRPRHQSPLLPIRNTS